MTTFVIDIKERDGKHLGRCREEGWVGVVGYSGARDTPNAAAKRALGNYFHVRQNKVGEPDGEDSHART